MDYQRIAPIMSQLWAPLCAVTTRWHGSSNGQIAVAVAGASIVPERPRVLVSLWKTNLTHDLVAASKVFALNFLAPTQLELVRALGMASGRSYDKLARLPCHDGITGSPLVDGCFGYLDCRVINLMDGGDMTCFLADVVDGDVVGGQSLTWPDARGAMPKEWLAENDRRVQREIAISLDRMDSIVPTPQASPSDPT